MCEMLGRLRFSRAAAKSIVEDGLDHPALMATTTDKDADEIWERCKNPGRGLPGERIGPVHKKNLKVACYIARVW